MTSCYYAIEYKVKPTEDDIKTAKAERKNVDCDIYVFSEKGIRTKWINSAISREKVGCDNLHDFRKSMNRDELRLRIKSTKQKLVALEMTGVHAAILS